MTDPFPIVVFGGTTEATALVTALAPRVGTDIDLEVSFAGRTAAPTAPAGRVRIGGFGGTDGLVDHLRANGVRAVVDALHPFASVMPFHLADACAQLDVPLLKLQRAAWAPVAGDHWIEVGDMTDAATAVTALAPDRVLLTIGRQELDPFRPIAGPSFVVRSIEPPDLAGAWSASALLDRGPFTVEGELDLLRAEAIDVLVTKNSGGAATASKLAATRELGLPVVMVERPPMPPAERVESVDAALAWIDGQLAGS